MIFQHYFFEIHKISDVCTAQTSKFKQQIVRNVSKRTFNFQTFAFKNVQSCSSAKFQNVMHSFDDFFVGISRHHLENATLYTCIEICRNLPNLAQNILKFPEDYFSKRIIHSPPKCRTSPCCEARCSASSRRSSVTRSRASRPRQGLAGCCIARDRASLTGLVLGCVEAKICKKICV